MFSSMKSPVKNAKHSSVAPVQSAASASNFFDSDDEKDVVRPDSSHQRLKNDLFNDHKEKKPASRYAISSRSNYKNDFRDSGGLENQSVQELEDYAVYKAEETTKAVNGCLKIAEDMRVTAANTMDMLHHQGDQITRTHRAAADIDHDLSRGEKLQFGDIQFVCLGGMFKMDWKPKKSGAIRGPELRRDDGPRKGSAEQREKLGLSSSSGAKNQQYNARSEFADGNAPNNSLQKVEVEKNKQDDRLSELSNVLGDIKDMAIDMGHELDGQRDAMDPFLHDIDILNDRVNGAVRRGQELLRK